ncbi:catalase [Duganella sp. FT92W]|uniref:Catalase n=1 Tax=Pseudoduganella rivuli TaxID=2666085 RepID=A0A7X2IL69_9BURK|nr:putative metalloprotease CJM1_0395 family protein [Pseudoduganella rivuli]MRV71905.1 catalase [Pseudoduganella rivuli]
MAINAISSSAYIPAAAPPAGAAARTDKTELTPEQQAQIDKLKATDTKVRQHEQAHLAAAGGLATSGPTYTYQRGPNGVAYAVGGEVNINTSPGATPQETIARAQRIVAAALAPADPSGQDRGVAARAAQMERDARVELEQAYSTDAKARPSIDVEA